MNPKIIAVAVVGAVTPHQIDDFPTNCQRSVVGSLHIRRGTLELTEDELAHIKARHPKVYACLHIPAPPAVAPATPEPALALAPEASESKPIESKPKSKHK